HACEVMANLRHPCKIIGIAITSRTLNHDEALAEVARAEDMYGLPACDVYRTGAEKLVQASIALRKELLTK
ncbi:MAG TPA: DUF1611 domain-containing protein, partial [Pirellula sp.]|nr:DUF1611 domain-containing protein [Pirellula sp.]